MADTSKPVIVSCRTSEHDTLTVRTSVARPGVLMMIKTLDRSEEVILDEPEARAVFNWLGAWLMQPKD